jgi:hypothetical protein
MLRHLFPATAIGGAIVGALWLAEVVQSALSLA